MIDNKTVRFSDQKTTVDGKQRAWVTCQQLETIWLNTGTLCNLACDNCYIESSPTNDRLVYLSHQEVCAYLDEIGKQQWPIKEIGITGGEPFMNPEIIPIITSILAAGHPLLVLTNAMKPMMHKREALLTLKETYGEQLTLRVSIDHYTQELHEKERGPKSWEPMIKGLQWLSEHQFHFSIAGRTCWNEREEEMRKGYAAFFAEHHITLDVRDPEQLVLFPEMDLAQDPPEITTECWDILKKSPDDLMCANARMVVKRKGEDKPAVVACTLLPYDEHFELGNTLKESLGDVPLNHPYCASFCVLGGGTCS